MHYDETWNMKYWNFVINQYARIKPILASGDVRLARCNCRLTTDFTSRHNRTQCSVNMINGHTYQVPRNYFTIFRRSLRNQFCQFIQSIFYYFLLVVIFNYFYYLVLTTFNKFIIFIIIQKYSLSTNQGALQHKKTEIG